MESLIDKKNVVFCSSIITYSFYIRGFYHEESVVLSKDVTRYGSRSRFPYYNLTTPYRAVPLLSATRGRTEQLCRAEAW
jgi:hypothetical protein